MVDLGTVGTAAAPRRSMPRARAVRRRRSLPGGRAVVGGFLVTASAVGVFAAYAAAGDSPGASYVVADRAVSEGDRLAPGDLVAVPMDLPAAQRALAFGAVDELVGATALGPLEEGQLVQVSDVVDPQGAPARAQISVPVEPGRALDGDLRAGERVDVMVTYSEGGAPSTTTVSVGASVVRVAGADAAVGGTGALTVVLAVPPAELEPLAQAAAAGEVTLARTTGLGGR